ncbi:hypothetical protein ACJJTC_001434 [Scirpophaga incertulas]
MNTNEVLWNSPAPSSVRFCRPILIEFSKETPEKTTLVVNDINAQILALNPSLINHNGEGIEIKHTLFLTMIDGKVAQVLSETSSSAVCTICGAKPTEMNNLEKVMSCGRGIDATKFGQYAFDTAQLYVNKYKWFYMPSSVHKVLIHGESVIRHFSVLPLGQLSEDAQESRNKDYKQFQSSSRKEMFEGGQLMKTFYTHFYIPLIHTYQA